MENIKFNNLFKNYGGILKTFAIALLILIAIVIGGIIVISIIGSISETLAFIAVIAWVLLIFVYAFRVFIKLLRKFYFKEEETKELAEASKMMKVYLAIVIVLSIILIFVLVGSLMSSPLQTIISLNSNATILSIIISAIASVYMVYFVYQVKKTKEMWITITFFLVVSIVATVISSIVMSLIIGIFVSAVAWPLIAYILVIIVGLLLTSLYTTLKFNFANNMRNIEE